MVAPGRTGNDSWIAIPRKTPPGGGAKFGGAFGSDGHGVIFVVTVTLYRLGLHVLGVGADRREAVHSAIRALAVSGEGYESLPLSPRSRADIAGSSG